jgi:hypothetical protein
VGARHTVRGAAGGWELRRPSRAAGDADQAGGGR